MTALTDTLAAANGVYALLTIIRDPKATEALMGQLEKDLAPYRKMVEEAEVQLASARETRSRADTFAANVEKDRRAVQEAQNGLEGREQTVRRLETQNVEWDNQLSAREAGVSNAEKKLESWETDLIAREAAIKYREEAVASFEVEMNQLRKQLESQREKFQAALGV